MVKSNKKNLKRLNRKGFTLTELLAVIAILSIISVVVIYSAISIIGSTKEKSYTVTKNNIEKKAGSYALENQLELSWKNPDMDDSVEYYCVSVQDLIDAGYFDSTVYKSEISSGNKVSSEHYIYLERDTTSKTITKNELIVDVGDPLMGYCKSIISSGDIIFDVKPSGWSKSKDVVINYNIKNYDVEKKYYYYYEYDKDSTIVNDNDNEIVRNSLKKEITVTTNGTLNAKIMEDGVVEPFATKSLGINKIDNIGPNVLIEIENGNTYSKEKDVVIKLTDDASGFRVGKYKIYYDWSDVNRTCDDLKSNGKEVEITINNNNTKNYIINDKYSSKTGAGKLYVCGEKIVDYVGNEIINNLFSADLYLDNERPSVALGSYTGSNNVSKSVTIPIIVSDRHSGIDVDSFTASDIKVMIGGTTLTSGIVLEKSDNNIYNIVINNSTNNGALSISINSDALSDNAGNGNSGFEVNTGVVFKNEYRINYYSYDGATKIGSSTHTYDSDSNLTLATTLKAVAPNGNVKFYGWATSANSTTKVYDDGASIKNLTDDMSKDVSLYAIWRSDEVKVTFKSGLNSATVTSSTGNYYYNASNNISVTLGTPANISSWSTLGWRDDTTAGTKEYSSGAKVSFSKSVTLYAVYSRSHSATFYSGVNKASNKKITGLAYYNSSAASTPTGVSITTATATDCANISNWTELGWRDDTSAGAKEVAYSTSKNILFGTTYNYYAVYSRELVIKYNGNGNTSGSTSDTTQTIYLNTNSTTTSSQSVTLKSNGFIKTDHKFTKWAYGSITGTQYAAGVSFNPSLAYNSSSFTVNMYALWKKLTFEEKYDLTPIKTTGSIYAWTVSSSCTYAGDCNINNCNTVGIIGSGKTIYYESPGSKSSSVYYSINVYVKVDDLTGGKGAAVNSLDTCKSLAAQNNWTSWKEPKFVTYDGVKYVYTRTIARCDNDSCGRYRCLTNMTIANHCSLCTKNNIFMPPSYFSWGCK